MTCCRLHLDEGCCDAFDCGPCCEDCPTCPTINRTATAILLVRSPEGNLMSRRIRSISDVAHLADALHRISSPRAFDAEWLCVPDQPSLPGWPEGR